MHIQEILTKNTTNSHNMIASHNSWDQMVYIRLFEGCNLNCEHCFIPSNPKKIPSSFYENNGLTNELLNKGNIKENQTLYLQWHGGEPTLLGVKYLEEAIENIEKDTRFKYQHGIQTNLFNFDDSPSEWAAFYQKYFNSHIGISWDFGIRHTNKKVLDASTNEEFENKFWKNLTLARSFDLNFYMVITATKLFFEHFKNPLDFFEMITQKGITHLNFERITNNGNARLNWKKLGLTNKEYSDYMSKFFKYYLIFKNSNQDIELNISPFDGLLSSVINMEKKNKTEPSEASIWDVMSYKNQGYGCWSGQCDTRFHTIDSNGYKYGCTALTSEQDNKNKNLQKSIETKKILWIGSTNSEQKNNILNQRKERQESCIGCEFLSICSSGCLSIEKFDESGECSGAKTLFKTIQKEVKKFI